MWVKMGSLLWMLLTAPENSRISVDSSSTSAGCSPQSTASCEPSTLGRERGTAQSRATCWCPQPGGAGSTQPLARGCILRMFPAGMKVQPPFCTIQRYVTAGTEKAPGLPGGRAGSWAVPPVSSHLYTSSLNAGIS